MSRTCFISRQKKAKENHLFCNLSPHLCSLCTSQAGRPNLPDRIKYNELNQTGPNSANKGMTPVWGEGDSYLQNI